MFRSREPCRCAPDLAFLDLHLSPTHSNFNAFQRLGMLPGSGMLRTIYITWQTIHCTPYQQPISCIIIIIMLPINPHLAVPVLMLILHPLCCLHHLQVRHLRPAAGAGHSAASAWCWQVWHVQYDGGSAGWCWLVGYDAGHKHLWHVLSYRTRRCGICGWCFSGGQWRSHKAWAQAALRHVWLGRCQPGSNVVTLHCCDRNGGLWTNQALAAVVAKIQLPYVSINMLTSCENL
jgi:hypothetical protein